MPVQEDYSREAWRRRKGISVGEERPRRSYQHRETPHDHMARARRINYLFIFFGLSVVTMIGLVLYVLYTLASLLPSLAPAA